MGPPVGPFKPTIGEVNLNQSPTASLQHANSCCTLIDSFFLRVDEESDPIRFRLLNTEVEGETGRVSNLNPGKDLTILNKLIPMSPAGSGSPSTSILSLSTYPTQ